MALSGSFNTNKYDNKIGLTLSWTGTQSIANNQTTIKWTLKSSGGSSGSWYMAAPITVVINGTTVLSVTTRFKLYGDGAYKKTGTIVINHNEDGSKSVAMSVRAAIYSASVNCTGSKTFTLDKISRYATITAAPDFYDTDNPTITYSNPAGELVDSLQACISLTGSTDNIAYRDISKTGTSYTFNLTQAERNTLLAACPNSNTLNVIFYVKTELAGNTFYSTLNKTMTVRDANPTITGVAYEDTSSLTDITENAQLIIQNFSTVRFTFDQIRALKYANLASIEVTVNGVTQSQQYDPNIATIINSFIDFGTINSSSDLTASIKVTDTRGNTVTTSINITMLTWSLPTAIISCARVNNYYSDTILNVDASYSSLDNKNTLRIRYQYQAVGSGSWSNPVTIQDNTPTTINLDNTKQWNIRVLLNDRLGSTTYNLTIDRGIPIIFFDRLKRSVSINCFPENNNSVESDGLQIDDLKYIGSQSLYSDYMTQSQGEFCVVTSYDYRLIQTLFSSITIPDNYERAYRITAQVTTSNNNLGSVRLNNINSNAVNTWSNNIMRVLCSTPIFKESDIVLETAHGYSKQGLNLYVVNSGNNRADFYNLTVHGYLVKKSTNLPQTAEADDDPTTPAS